MTRNRLDKETSPYLLQHKDNLVHWQPWDERALVEARTDNKPILLSVGYAACHWCHVMAHESFEDPETACMMNEMCINIKVDREERPDIDFIYQNALTVIGEHGGWPLTMFLAPDGVPLWGGTYFPLESRFGRPAFRDVVTTVVNAYHRQPQRVARSTAVMRQALQRLSRTEASGVVVVLSLSSFNRVAQALVPHLDPVHGGFQGAPKFPQFPLFGFLWRAWRRTRAPQLASAVQLTLERICQGGIYDHLGGGLARYSTDEVWLVPHFEKMLYDNALFIDILTTVWQDVRYNLFAHRIAEVVAWVAREMIAGPGAFASSLDADSEGVEGRFYIWSVEEIDTVLGSEAPLFREAYGVIPNGQWEGHNILHRPPSAAGGRGGSTDPAHEERLRVCRSRLLDVRETRPRPSRDDKILADWNGLMIQALARAGMLFAQPGWVALATQAFATICTHMTWPGDRLGHSLCQGRLQTNAMLDDYANMSLAALALLEVTADPAYLEQARRWVATANRSYWDDEGGGYFFTAVEATDLITRTKTAVDNAMPSGNGGMAYVLARLYHITGAEAYRQRAETIFSTFALNERLPSLATLMNAFEHLHAATLVVIVGPEAGHWHQHVLTAPISNLIVLSGPVNSLLVQGKPMVNGLVTAYVCRGQTCSAPFTALDALMKTLDGG